MPAKALPPHHPSRRPPYQGGSTLTGIVFVPRSNRRHTVRSLCQTSVLALGDARQSVRKPALPGARRGLANHPQHFSTGPNAGLPQVPGASYCLPYGGRIRYHCAPLCARVAAENRAGSSTAQTNTFPARCCCLLVTEEKSDHLPCSHAGRACAVGSRWSRGLC